MGKESKSFLKKEKGHTVLVTAHLHYQLPPFSDLHPVLTGSSPELGEWDISHSIKGIELSNGWWTFDIHLKKNTQEFKFVVVNEDKDIVRWEECNNHTLHLENVSGHYLLLHQWGCGYGISKLLGAATQVVPAEESIHSTFEEEEDVSDFGLSKSMTMPEGEDWLVDDSTKSNTLPRSSSHGAKNMGSKSEDTPSARVKRFRSFRKMMSRTRRAFSTNQH